MKITQQRERAIEAVSLRSAWLISRAWRPTWESPISPSSSARGTRAATLSITTMSMAPERDQRVGDFERLLAGVGLRDEKLVHVDVELAGIDRIERVLGVDEGAGAAELLGLGDAGERQRGLARALRPVDLDNPAARQPADAERHVQPDGAGRDRLDLDGGTVAELHDRALAEGPLDLAERRVQCLLFVHGTLGNHAKRRIRHVRLLISHGRNRCNVSRCETTLGLCTLFVLSLQPLICSPPAHARVMMGAASRRSGP